MPVVTITVDVAGTRCRTPTSLIAILLEPGVSYTTLLLVAGFGGVGGGNLIPAIFCAKSQLSKDAGDDPITADQKAMKLSGALIGAAGAIGGLGGVAVNLAFRQSFLTTGAGNCAYVAFVAFYAVCFAPTWSMCMRPSPKRLVAV